MSSTQDMWLKSSLSVGPFSTPPAPQQIAELLAKAPWVGFSGNEQSFHWELVDRPEAGTSFLSFISPPNKPLPPDGLRFLPANPQEVTSTSVHTVQCPVSLAAPTTIQSIQVELTCYSATQGHFGPQSRNSGFLPDSPELTLARYRRRYHLSRGGGSPALFFVFYGRDDSGGTGQGQAPKALDGWDKLPVRKYPLAKQDSPSDPVYIFPAPGRAATAAGILPGAMPGQVPPTQAQQQQQQQQQGQGMMGTPNRPFGAPQSQPGGQMTPTQQQQAQAAYYRQQQLAALQMQQQAAAGAGAGGMDPRQYQAQMAVQQQQAAMAYQAAQAQAQSQGQGQGGAGGAGQSAPPQPNAAYASQLAQYQQLQAQQAQQQQAALAAQQQASQKALLAQQQARMAAARPPPPAAIPSSIPRPTAHSVPVPLPSHPTQATEDEKDILDHLTARQLAIHRYAKQHELLAGLMGEPWKVSEIVEGKKRKREAADSAKTKGGEKVERGKLEELAISVGRFSEEVKGEEKDGDKEKADPTTEPSTPITAVKRSLTLEERREQLLKMQQETEKEIEEMKERFEKQKHGLKSRPGVVVV